MLGRSAAADPVMTIEDERARAIELSELVFEVVEQNAAFDARGLALFFGAHIEEQMGFVLFAHARIRFDAE